MVFMPSEFLPEYRPARKYSLFESNGWWLNRWPLLGWLETFVKASAWCFVPYITLTSSSSSTSSVASSVPDMPLSFAVGCFIMLLASSLLALAVIDRLVYRELVSIIFVFPNNWAHWSVALAMQRYGRQGINIRYFRIFLLLTLAGDIIKLIFFAVHDFSRLNVSRYFLYMLVAIFALMYVAVLLLDYGYVTLDDVVVGGGGGEQLRNQTTSSWCLLKSPPWFSNVLQRIVVPTLVNFDNARRYVEKTYKLYHRLFFVSSA